VPTCGRVEQIDLKMMTIMPEKNIDLSVIIPVYNGANTIANVVEAVERELFKLSYEIILINDGSQDDSEFVCENLAFQNPMIRFISLRKNFGEHNAVLCGLNFAVGYYSVIIDDDFQNPPSEIIKLYSAIVSGGYDVVYSKYHSKKHNLLRRLGSKFHNFIASYILEKPKNLYLSSFKIIKKEIVTEIISYKGPYPYIDGLLLQVTSNIGTCLVEHRERLNGKSNYTMKKLISLYLNMFINHSIRPMRSLMLVGLVAFFIGTVLRVAIFINYHINNIDTSTTVYHAVLYITLSGVQLLFMGLIGEYIIKAVTSSGGYSQFSIKSSSQSKQKHAATINNTTTK
jgi:polyisoprenyl-phosphate glycosyltransferase